MLEYPDDTCLTHTLGLQAWAKKILCDIWTKNKGIVKNCYVDYSVGSVVVDLITPNESCLNLMLYPLDGKKGFYCGFKSDADAFDTLFLNTVFDQLENAQILFSDTTSVMKALAGSTTQATVSKGFCGAFKKIFDRKEHFARQISDFGFDAPALTLQSYLIVVPDIHQDSAIAHAFALNLIKDPFSLSSILDQSDSSWLMLSISEDTFWDRDITRKFEIFFDFKYDNTKKYEIADFTHKKEMTLYATCALDLALRCMGVAESALADLAVE